MNMNINFDHEFDFEQNFDYDFLFHYLKMKLNLNPIIENVFKEWIRICTIRNILKYEMEFEIKKMIWCEL